MKKSTFLMVAAFVGTSLSSFGQNPDLGIADLPSLYTNMPVYDNIPVTVQYTVKNYGTITLTDAVADTLRREISVNGVIRLTGSFSLGAAGLGAGVTSGAFTANQTLDFSTFGLAAGKYAVCNRSQIRKNGTNIDVDQNNDEFCVVVDYTGGPLKFDAAISNVVITSPYFAPNSHIPIPTFPSELSFDLSNDGTNQMEMGLLLPIIITVAGTPTPFPGSLGQGLSAGGSFTAAVSFPGSLPITKGPFDVCIELDSPDDTNPNNDNSCTTYNMGPPVSVDEVEAEVYGEMYYNGGVLNLKFNEKAQGLATVNLFETSGRHAGSYDLNLDQNRNHTVDLNKLTNGVYIANIVVNNDVITYKFVVK